MIKITVFIYILFLLFIKKIEEIKALYAPKKIPTY